MASPWMPRSRARTDAKSSRFDRFAKVLEQLFPDYEPGGALAAAVS